MDLKITIDGHEELSQFLKKIEQQIPYATSVAINDTLNHAQKAVQNSLAARFVLRRPQFVLRTIKRNRDDFATKRRLFGAVRIDPERDFLAPHEEGGTKKPVSGTHVAIPIGVKRNANDIITRANRPRQMLDKKGFFKIEKQGTLLIVRKTGKGKSARTVTQYLFKKGVRLKPQLGFLATADRAIDAHWPVAVESAIDRALRTAR